MKTAIGLMSGTSMDGVDAAIIETDGQFVKSFGATHFTPYSQEFTSRLQSLLGAPLSAHEQGEHIEIELTRLHVVAVEELVKKSGLCADEIDVIGFHGHTIHHDPANGVTCQIGNAKLLARETAIDVVADLRSADVMAGGEGAPLAPVFHQALARELPKPLAVLNLGGVANVSWIGDEGELVAFDTGPGNALLDDWMRRHYGKSMDEGGKVAAKGCRDEAALVGLMAHAYFSRPHPKSLDRNDFSFSEVEGLSPEDGAATLVAFTAASISQATEIMPRAPLQWLVGGGGRHNPTLMSALQSSLGVPVAPVEAVGWDGDALEAQAFGFLAVRSLYELALTYPGTTGVPAPQSGGVLFQAS